MRLLLLVLIIYGLCWSCKANEICGDSIVEDIEECDDGAQVSGDGCSANCLEESGFNCSINSNSTSFCSFLYLLDLDTSDGSLKLNLPDRILLSTTEYLIDMPFVYGYAVINGTVWDNISVVIMDNLDNSNNGEYVVLQISKAVQDGRLSDGTLVDDVIRDEIEVTSGATHLEDILGAKIFRGYIYTPNTNNPDDFVSATLKSLRYIYENTTNFVPRNICIVAEYGQYHSVACINATFVGTNSNPPALIYTQAGESPRFTEGQSVPTLIFNGDLQAEDPNHPMYLMVQATVTILAAQEQFEKLWLNQTFPSLNSSYDASTGRLTITGNSTTEVYERALRAVVYNNSNEEPSQLTRIRQITIILFDGSFTGQLETDLLLVNRDDVPTILFSSNGITTYYEGNGSVAVDSSLYVVDIDPNEMIQKVVIDLLDAYDNSNELITINRGSLYPQVSITSQQHKLELQGNATPSAYQEILRRLSYEHTDSEPGNPTPGNRTIQFFIEDDGLFNRSINTSFTIVPINDAPEMSFNNSNLEKTLQYAEDDHVLFLAADLYLRDVDSNISMATLYFTGLLNGPNDHFFINQTLASSYGLTFNMTDQQTSTTIIVSGSATYAQYREILQTLAYNNLLQNNTVTDGIRKITLQVSDEEGSESPVLTIDLHVSERNDEPAVNIDEILEFTEGSMSKHIITLHLISIMDEELNNISSINVTLTATNGELDEGDNIFVRSINNPFIDKAIRTRHSIYIPCEGTVNEFEDVLRSIFYLNEEDEPTYYVNAISKEKLRREIVIELTDNNITHPATAIHRILVNITLINDHTPNITLKLTNSSCLVSYPGSINKRNTRFAASSHSQRRLQVKRKGSSIHGMAPAVEAAYSQFSSLVDNITCLSNITIIFNANTTTPLVEVKRDLQDILTLSPSDLNLFPHYGKWLNKYTLVVNFMGCYQLTDSEMHVVFRSHKDYCDMSTTCTTGICFSNHTGCPLTGLQPIKCNSTTHINDTSTVSAPIPHQKHRLVPYLVLVILLGFALVILIAGIKIMHCIDRPKKNTKSMSPNLHYKQHEMKLPETLQPTDCASLPAKCTPTETAHTDSINSKETTTQSAGICKLTATDTDREVRGDNVSQCGRGITQAQSSTSQEVTSQSRIHHKDTNSSNNYQLVKLTAEH